MEPLNLQERAYIISEEQSFDEAQSEATLYTDVFSEEALQENVDSKQVNRSSHPQYEGVAIYKYSREAQHLRNWNEVTSACRGLIINHETGELLARPFSKFFNYGELTDQQVEAGAVGRIEVLEKLDGSFIVGYTAPDGRYRLTTAGGFQSQQHVMAEEIYAERYADRWVMRPNTTYMWELIHPDNRIVVNYGDERDLYLLGAVDIPSGRSVPLSELTEWKWKKADIHTFDSLESVVSAPERSNREGYIIHFPETDFRIKLKHDEYVALHRDATGLSERRIWRYLRDGEYETNRSEIQEEFISFYDTVGADIMNRLAVIKQSYYDEYERLEQSFTGTGKREWVDHVRANGSAPAQSVMLSWFGREEKTFTKTTENAFWERVKPEETRSFWQLQGEQYFKEKNTE